MRSAPADGSAKEVYTCHCGQSYSRLEYLRRHARKHEDIKPFGCSFCEKAFGRSDVLLRHKRRCHPVETAAEEAEAASQAVNNVEDSGASGGGRDIDGPASLDVGQAYPSAGPSEPRKNINTGRSRGPGSISNDNALYDAGPSFSYGIGDQYEGSDGNGHVGGIGGKRHAERSPSGDADAPRRPSQRFRHGYEDHHPVNGYNQGPGGLNGSEGWGEGPAGPDFTLDQAQRLSSRRLPGQEEFPNGHGSTTLGSLERRRLEGRQDGDRHARQSNFPIPTQMPQLDWSQFANGNGQGSYGIGTAHSGISDLASHMLQPRDAQQLAPLSSNYADTRIPRIPPINAAWQDQQYDKVDSIGYTGRRRVRGSSGGEGTIRPVPDSSKEHGIEDAATLLAMAYGMGQQASASSSPDGMPPQSSPDVYSSSILDGPAHPGQDPSGGERQVPQESQVTKQVQQAVAAYANQAQAKLEQLDESNSELIEVPSGLTANPDMGWTGVTTPAIESENKQLGTTRTDNLGLEQQMEIINPGFISSLFPFVNFGEKDHLDQDDIDGLSYLPGSFWDVDLINPSRPLSRIGSAEWRGRFGRELPIEDRYFIRQDRFAGCYTIPHWGIPSMDTLKRIARQTVGTVLHHLPILHLPTFKLLMSALPVTFAICTLGSPLHAALNNEVSRTKGPSTKVTKESLARKKKQARDDWVRGMGVIAPVAASDQISELEENPTEEESSFDGRKGKVADEKSAMIYSIWLAGKGRQLTDYNFGIMQALLLFATPSLMAADLEARRTGYAYLTPCIEIAHQMGLLDITQSHCKVYFAPPTTLTSPLSSAKSLRESWTSWIKLEAFRRNAFILYIFDTLRALETGTETAIRPVDLAHMPVPAPDTLWKAQSAEEWNVAFLTYQSTTLDVCLQRLFQEEGDLGFGMSSAIPGFEDVTVMNRSDFGAFARLIMVITLLRGIVDIGHGKRSTGTYMDVYSLWMTESRARGIYGPAVDRQLRLSDLLGMYGIALQRWREGWDFDSLCGTPSILDLGPAPDGGVAGEIQLFNRESTSSDAAASATVPLGSIGSSIHSHSPIAFDGSGSSANVFSPFDISASFSGPGSGTGLADSPGMGTVPALETYADAWTGMPMSNASGDNAYRAGSGGIIQARTGSATSSDERLRTPSQEGRSGNGRSEGAETGTGGDGAEDGEEFAGVKRDQTLFYEEALPYYWICQALQNNLITEIGIQNTRRGGPLDAGSPQVRMQDLGDAEAKLKEVAQRNVLQGTDLGGMLQSARVFTRMGEGIHAV